MKFLSALVQKNTDPTARAPVTMACLGDSVTHGCFEIFRDRQNGIDCVFDCEAVYHAQLRKMLKPIFSALSLTVVNAGIGGDSAPGGLDRLERDVLAYAPDLVTVCFGLNDVNGGLEHIGKYEDAITGILRTLRGRGIETIFMTPNMLNTYVNPSITDAGFIEIAENTANLQNTGVMDAYMDCARAVCVREDVPVCDCYRKWRRLAEAGVDTTALLCNDINHPTREMHTLFAQSLYEMMLFGE